MPRNKDLKRHVRARMQKTGESYTSARSRVVEKATRRLSETELAARAGMSSDAVLAKTGRTWAQWVRTLDGIGAVSMPHRAIAEHVHAMLGVPAWWSQTVTVGYERIRGLREIGQRRGGGFDANKSKTFPVAVERLYRAFSVARTRNRWMLGVPLQVRKATPHKSLRISWQDGTPVDVYFTPKGDAKSQVAIQHRGLPSKQRASQAKAFWDEHLRLLNDVLAARKTARR